MQMQILINGAGGQMGRTLTAILQKEESSASLAGRVDPFVREDGILPSLSAFEGRAHCVIDFSSHEGTVPLLDWAIAKGLPVVLCTTGQTEQELAVIRSAAEQIPLFFSGNMSLGVALLSRLVCRAAQLFPEADIEIVESHHNRKTDVPSGTALMLAQALQTVRPNAAWLAGRRENGRRNRNEIGIHSLRMGGCVGTHEVILHTGTQLLSLKHEALDRSVYAEGALSAAAFLLGKAPGLYTMEHLLEERRLPL